MPKGDRNTELNRWRAAQKRLLQEKNYTVDRVTGCWIWGGGVSNDGYGKLKRLGKTLRAHRFFYERFVGKIPDRLVVCHRCDTPLCVNPTHLFIGTPLDNERDKDRKHRRSPSPSVTHPHTIRRGERHHKAKLTSVFVKEIRGSRLPTRILADRFDVSMSTIQRVRKGVLWRHVCEN